MHYDWLPLRFVWSFECRICDESVAVFDWSCIQISNALIKVTYKLERFGYCCMSFVFLVAIEQKSYRTRHLRSEKQTKCGYLSPIAPTPPCNLYVSGGA